MNPSINWKIGLVASSILLAGLVAIRYFGSLNHIQPFEIIFFLLATLPYFNMKNRGFLLFSLITMQIFFTIWDIIDPIGENFGRFFIYDSLVFAAVIIAWLFGRIKRVITMKIAIALAICNILIFLILLLFTGVVQLGFFIIYSPLFEAFELVGIPFAVSFTVYFTIPWLILYMYRKYHPKINPLRNKFDTTTSRT